MNVAKPSIYATPNGDVYRCDFPVWFLNGEEYPGVEGNVDYSDGRFSRRTVVTKTEGVGSVSFNEALKSAMEDLDRLNDDAGFRERELELEALEGKKLEAGGMAVEVLRESLPEGLKLPDDVNFPRAFKLFTLVVLAKGGTDKEKKEAMMMFVPPAYFNSIGAAKVGLDFAQLGAETADINLQDMVNVLVYNPGEDKATNFIGLPDSVRPFVASSESTFSVVGGEWFEKVFSSITHAMARIKLGEDVVTSLRAVKGHEYLDLDLYSLEGGMALLDEASGKCDRVLALWVSAKEFCSDKSRDGELSAERKKKALRLFSEAVLKREEPMAMKKRNAMYRNFYGMMEQVWQVDFLFEYYSEAVIFAKPKNIQTMQRKFYLILFGVYRENQKEIKKFLSRVATE